MARIVFMTNIARRLKMMQQTLEKLQQEGKMDKSADCLWVTESTVWNREWQEKLKDTDFLMLKWMGTGLDTPFLQTCVKKLKDRKIPCYIDAAGRNGEELSSGLTEKQINTIRNYSILGGEKNYYNSWLYAARCLSGGEETVESPDPICWCGIFHPDAKDVYTDFREYEKDFLKAGRPTAGILFYRDEWVWGDLQYQTALIKEAEKQGMNVICVFTTGMPIESLGMPSLTEVFDRFFVKDGKPAIDALINIIKFSITSSGSMTIDYLKKLNVPVLQGYSILASYEEWAGSLEGMNAMEVSISLALPEFDGVIHGAPVSTKKVLENGDVRYLPVQERIERIMKKAAKWARLKHKENSEKKVAVIFHNYPPRNSNIGSAVGLDTIESVRRLLHLMRQRGYKVNSLPEDGKEFIKELTAHATNDRAMLNEKQLKEAYRITGKEYGEFFSAMEKSAQQQLEKDWGRAPGSVMEYGGDLLVPGTMNGNVFVTVQPPRGFGEDPGKIYHSPFCAPTHQYLGVYRWIRDIWGADAAAHIGTHGSLEWLPGKNAGLGPGCYPDLALGDLPNIYPYNITITGEGIQAKRRGSACLVEHLPAPQTRAGLYAELEELEKILEEYAHFAKTQPENLPQLEEMVRKKTEAANLKDEVPFDEEKPFAEYAAKLHNYITDLKNMEVHTGLHILGQYPENEELAEYLQLLTRLDNGGVPSLNKTVAGAYGFDYYHLLENSSLIYEPLNITYGVLIEKIAGQCLEIIKTLQQGDFTEEAVRDVLELPWIKDKDQAFKDNILKISRYICFNIYPNLLLTTQEMDNILRALEGQYIEPSPSGAPSSGGADLLPTGRNFYGLDPRTLPTPAAWEIGKELADQVITRFIAEEGHYPENIGIVLWSGSNMRSHGQCAAEILYLMGVRPKYQSGSMRVIGLEPIELSELKRPRIDVTGRISGLFRDTMASVVELLDEAVLLVAGLDESDEDNFIKKHVTEDSAQLEQGGMKKEDAWRQASFRIFGDEQGVYGAGVAALLEEKNWETIDDIADVYVRWGAHAYGGDTKGEYLPELFRKRMGSLDITIKNENHHETNMLSSDDYNAYHGGMVAAVRSIKGSAPKSYCGDSTDRSKVTMHSLKEETMRIFRSESINPKFIAGMMKHGYKGAADLANMVAHSYHWDATSAVMEDWMYEKYAEKYAFDPETQKWMREVNPWALQRLSEVLLEASRRGLWNAKEETLAELRRLYLDIEGEVEERADAGR